MTDDAQPPPEGITPAWLTGTLRRAGILPRGAVTAIDGRGNAAFNSTVTHLAVTYSADAPAGAPAALVLKRNRPKAWAVEAGAREVAFYRLVAVLGGLPMSVPCYAAAHDPASGASFVLMRDLSATHHAPQTRDQQLQVGQHLPDAKDIDRVITTLADFHAFWWQHPRLGGDGAPVGQWYRDAGSFAQLVARRTAAWESLLAAEGGWLPLALADLYASVLACLPRLWERFLAPRVPTLAHMTLTHGDAYFCNFLCPNEPGVGSTYLLDWQCPEVYLAASDLVNLCVTFWTPAQRRQDGREERLLRRYHNRLLANGVIGYAWHDLHRDYRLAVIDWLLVPLQDRADGAPTDYWWPKMRCLAAAFTDLDCAALLAEA